MPEREQRIVEVEAVPMGDGRSGARERPGGGEETPGRLALGCFLMLLGAPLCGLVAWALGSFSIGFAAWSLAFLGAAIWTGWSLIRSEGKQDFRPVWSFNPLSSMVLAATDVVAIFGDAAGGATLGAGYLVIVVPVALFAGGVVLLLELVESGRFFYSLAKALAAIFLVLLPTPIGGLLGAGASWGHRLLSMKDVLAKRRERA
jgi:hypothetical protein